MTFKTEVLFPDEKKTKKKKKKAKKNQTMPSEDGVEMEDRDDYSWEPSSRAKFKASKSPRLDPLEEPEHENDCK